MNISDWIEFDITKADVKRAEELAKETREKARELGLKNVFRTRNELENEIIGLIGEDKFEYHLKELEINYEKDRPIGRSDKFDFKIMDKVLNVKTNLNDWHPSRSPYTYKFLVNEKQFDEHEDVAYYVSMMIYKFEKVWFCGLISQAEVSTKPIINPGFALCYSILYSDLHKPRELRNLLGWSESS